MPRNTKDYEISRFQGMNLNPDITQLQTGESPDMLNMVLDQDGTPDKRPGFIKAFTPLVETGGIKGLFHHEGDILFVQGTKLYKWDMDPDTVPTLLYSAFSGDKVASFPFNENLYFLDGTNFLVYNGTTVAPVVPYIPTIAISSPPTGGGVAFEDFNLLCSNFKQSFNGDNTLTTYQLNVFPLHADPLIVTNLSTSPATSYVENTDFTVNRDTGLVTFTVTPKPPTGINNILIQGRASADWSLLEQCVRKATGASIFGGRNDTRVHVWGNPEYPNRIYRSALLDPTYFPENAFSRFGTENTAVTGAVLQYETQVVFKEDSIYLQHFDVEGTPITGDPAFPTKPLNSRYGCIAPESLKVVENNPVFLSQEGVMTLVSSQVRDERNVVLISEKVNLDLLRRDMRNAVAVYFDGSYILTFPDGFSWVYNTRVSVPVSRTESYRGVWYPWDGIPATVYLYVGDTLYFGGANGVVYKMLDMFDSRKHQDDGQAISAYITTKVFGFEAESFYKMLQYIHVTLRPQLSQSSVKVRYRTDRRGPWEEFETYGSTVFSYTGIVYSKWTYFASAIPTTKASRLKVRRAIYYQFRFENDEIYVGVGILRLAIRVTLQKGVR